MKSKDFCEKCLFIATQTETVYMWGTWGNQLTDDLVDKKAEQYPKRYSKARLAELRGFVGLDVWAWDCSGLIKGILWCWENDLDEKNGGAVYESNGVEDKGAGSLFNTCTDISEDFSGIIPGELVYKPGHIGVYVGDQKVVEATLSGDRDGVVITDLHSRGWTKHGKCVYLEYPDAEDSQDDAEAAEKPRLYIHVERVGLYIRDSLSFNSRKKASGKILSFCPIGEEMEILDFIPGIQKDGYQWVKTRYNGIEGFSQYDSSCYYIFEK